MNYKVWEFYSTHICTAMLVKLVVVDLIAGSPVNCMTVMQTVNVILVVVYDLVDSSPASVRLSGYRNTSGENDSAGEE